MQPAPHCGKPIWLPRGKGGRGEGRGTAGGQSRPREGSRTCRAAGHSVRRGAGPVRMDARGPRTQPGGEGVGNASLLPGPRQGTPGQEQLSGQRRLMLRHEAENVENKHNRENFPTEKFHPQLVVLKCLSLTPKGSTEIGR